METRKGKKNRWIDIIYRYSSCICPFPSPLLLFLLLSTILVCQAGLKGGKRRNRGRHEGCSLAFYNERREGGGRGGEGSPLSFFPILSPFSLLLHSPPSILHSYPLVSLFPSHSLITLPSLLISSLLVSALSSLFTLSLPPLIVSYSLTLSQPSSRARPCKQGEEMRDRERTER